MQKLIYEIFDEIEMAESEQERTLIIQQNLSRTLVDVLKLTYHPDYQWHYSELPEDYIMPDHPPGMGLTQIGSELRRMYLFRKGDPKSDSLSDQKRMELLLQFLEAFEPRDVEIIIGIFKKDQQVEGLDYEFVSQCFPDMLPKLPDVAVGSKKTKKTAINKSEQAKGVEELSAILSGLPE